MNRADRVLWLLTGPEPDPLAAVERGVTAQDLDDAVSLARLDLELTQVARATPVRDMVREFLRILEA